MQYALVNKSQIVSDADCLLMHRAVYDQLCCHVAPSWNRLTPTGIFIPYACPVPEGYLPVYVIDRPDISGLLGYHNEDKLTGISSARVFVEPILANGGTIMTGDTSISVVLSHEIIELFIDSTCHLWSDMGNGSMVAYEACDPVNGESYVIEELANDKINAVSVSNFVFESWFDVNPGLIPQTHDWLRHRTMPLTIGRGGYLIVKDVENKTHVTFGSPEAAVQHASYHPKNRLSLRGCQV